jgi:hypothetical protein
MCFRWPIGTKKPARYALTFGFVSGGLLVSWFDGKIHCGRFFVL